MAFTGFSAAGVDLLSLNRLQNSKEFYEEHKAEIKKQEVYVKPEDFTAYYVINGDAVGKVHLF